MRFTQAESEDMAKKKVISPKEAFRGTVRRVAKKINKRLRRWIFQEGEFVFPLPHHLHRKAIKRIVAQCEDAGWSVELRDHVSDNNGGHTTGLVLRSPGKAIQEFAQGSQEAVPHDPPLDPQDPQLDT